MQVIYKTLATGFFISYLPPLVFKFKKNTGAGFLGTLWGVLLVSFFPTDYLLYLITLLAFWTLSVWVCQKVDFKKHDDPRIVIDEIAGYLTAMAFIPHSLGYLIAAFVLFRTFDTLKPWFIKTFDQIHNAFGIVFDDVCAGLMANILLQCFIVFYK